MGAWATWRRRRADAGTMCIMLAFGVTVEVGEAWGALKRGCTRRALLARHELNMILDRA